MQQSEQRFTQTIRPSMKLIVQIPCYNEEQTLAQTIADIPRVIEGIDQVEILIIDDGSTDDTARVATESGADHLLRFARNRGLGNAFRSGIDECLRLGADIIVNTDGDNQYVGADIPLLVAPVLAGQADMVIGDRQPTKVSHFSPAKKWLQQFGSRVMSWLADTEVPDVASGFRAYNRAAAVQLNTITEFDHTTEHVIQAGRSRLGVLSVPIRTNRKLRESRLFDHMGQFIFRSGMIGLRTFARYKALPVFTAFGGVTFFLGMLLGFRFLYYLLFTNEGNLHVQSVVLAGVLLLAGFQMFLIGVIADLIATNRHLLEEVLTRIRSKEGPGSDKEAKK